MGSIIRRAVLSLCALAVAVPAQAQAARTLFTPTLSAGVALPRGGVQHYTNYGYTVGAALDAARQGIPVSLRAEAGYTHFSFYQAAGNAHDGDRNQWSGALDAVLPVHTPVATPYLIAGAGLYQVTFAIPCTGIIYDASGATVPPNCPGGTSNHAGWSAGLGVDLPGGLLGSRLEARYTRIVIPGGFYSYVPVTFALRF
jgi:hypothetical protein